MQELEMHEVELVGGGKTFAQTIQEIIDALGMVGQLQEALVGAIVDVACTATTECR